MASAGVIAMPVIVCLVALGVLVWSLRRCSRKKQAVARGEVRVVEVELEEARGGEQAGKR